MLKEEQVSFEIVTTEGKTFRGRQFIYPDASDWFVYHERAKVARLYTADCDDGLKICDLLVQAEATPRGGRWRKLLHRLMGYEPVRYRRQGMGSALLRLAIRWARENEFPALFGNICARDLAENPRLIAWYEKHGFTRIDPLDSGYLASIHLKW